MLFYEKRILSIFTHTISYECMAGITSMCILLHHIIIDAPHNNAMQQTKFLPLTRLKKLRRSAKYMTQLGITVAWVVGKLNTWNICGLFLFNTMKCGEIAMREVPKTLRIDNGEKVPSTYSKAEITGFPFGPEHNIIPANWWTDINLSQWSAPVLLVLAAPFGYKKRASR